MSEAEMNGIWTRIFLLGRCMPTLDEMRELQDANERAQSIGFILDPTFMLRANPEEIDDKRRLLDAAVAFATQFERVKEMTLAKEPAEAKQ